MTRDYRFYLALSALLYGAGGTALALNTAITVGALRAAGIADAVAWLVAVLFSSTAIAISVYLTSPSEWSVLWDNFATTAASAGRGGRTRAPRGLSSAVLGLLILMLISYVAFAYYGDWISTWARIRGDNEPSIFHLMATICLIVGPEVSFCLGFAFWQRSRTQRIRQSATAATEDPQVVYLTESRKNAIKTAKASAAATAQQYQHPR